MKQFILRFSEFLNESMDYDFEIDQRFPWSEKINDLTDQIMQKQKYLITNFNYDKHGGQAFEFDIKARKFPDTEDLSKKYKYTENEIQDYWDLFLHDNLEFMADDIMESSYFSDWYTAGRSGGWLLLVHLSDLIRYPDSKIEDTLSHLNDQTDEIEEDEYEKWKEFHDIAGKGSRILGRMDIQTGDFEDIDDAERESADVILQLEEDLEYLQNLENELDRIQERIDNFWKDCEVNFEGYIEDESKMRDRSDDL